MIHELRSAVTTNSQFFLQLWFKREEIKASDSFVNSIHSFVRMRMVKR